MQRYVLPLCCFLAACSAFVSPFAPSVRVSRGGRAAHEGKSTPQVLMSADADFAKQELQIIFDTMNKNKVNFKMLGVEQTNRIAEFVNTLLDQNLPVDGKALAQSGALVGKWKLEWSSEDRYKLLPNGVEVSNYVFDPEGGRLDNVLRFANSPFIRSIRAIADYQVDTQNRVVFLFTRIIVGIFGFYLPLPFFGEGGGFIELQYFDGDFWMERFTEELGDGTKQLAVNVYRRVDRALTEKDKEECN